MEKQKFKININATREKVWNILWEEDTYPQWTAPFSEGSRAVTDWKKGSKVLFLNAENNGMVSTIADNIPYEYMAIKHLGDVKNGVEDIGNGKMKDWAGAMETYTLKTIGSQTELILEMDIVEAYKDYFSKTWPIALEKVKQLCEA